MQKKSTRNKDTKPSVVWLAQSMGYHNDLMYFEPIFSELKERLPNLKIAVNSDFPVQKYPRLPLWAIIRQNIHASVGEPGTSYTQQASRPLPTLATLRDIWDANPALIIVVEFTPIAICGLLIAKVRGAKSVLLIENHPRYRFGDRRFHVRVAKRLIASLATGILTNNREGYSFLTDELNLGSERIFIGPYLTSAPELCTEPGVSSLRRDKDKVNFLYLNSVTERKGLLDLMKAIASMNPDGRRGLLLHVVGSGDKMDEVKNYVAQHDIEGAVEFYGSVEYSRVNNYYEGADIYISPTRSDYRSLGGFRSPVLWPSAVDFKIRWSID